MAQKWILIGAVVILLLNVVVVINSTNDCSFDTSGGTESDLSSRDLSIKHPKQEMTVPVRWGSDSITTFNVRKF